MPTNTVPPFPPASRPPAETVAFRRQVWFAAGFLGWGAFEFGRWTEAADQTSFFAVLGACAGLLMVVTAIFALRASLRQLAAPPTNEPAR